MTPKYRPGPDPGKGKAVVESFKFKDRIYELRLNACGKTNCATCSGNLPRHGPYWYLCVPWSGKWRRIYIGKDLDTTKFICPDGSVDRLMLGKGARKPKASLSHYNEPSNPGSTSKPAGPHQTDMLEDAGLNPDDNQDGVFRGAIPEHGKPGQNPDESPKQSTYQPHDTRPDLEQNPDDDHNESDRHPKPDYGRLHHLD